MILLWIKKDLAINYFLLHLILYVLKSLNIFAIIAFFSNSLYIIIINLFIFWTRYPLLYIMFEPLYSVQ